MKAYRQQSARHMIRYQYEYQCILIVNMRTPCFLSSDMTYINEMKDSSVPNYSKCDVIYTQVHSTGYHLHIIQSEQTNLNRQMQFVMGPWSISLLNLQLANQADLGLNIGFGMQTHFRLEQVKMTLGHSTVRTEAWNSQ